MSVGNVSYMSGFDFVDGGFCSLSISIDIARFYSGFYGFKDIFINFDNLTVVPSDPMCSAYCMLTFSCFDVSRTSRGCKNMTSLTDIAMISKLDICQTKLAMSQYVPRTSEIDVRT